MDIGRDMTRQNIVNRVPDGYEEALLKALKYQWVIRKALPDLRKKECDLLDKKK